MIAPDCPVDLTPFLIAASIVNEWEYQALEDVVQGVGEFEQEFYAKKDRRAVFATRYLAFTRVTQRLVGRGTL